MSVSTTTNRVALAGNGATTSFAFPYYFSATTDLSVYKFDTLLGGIVLQALGVNYTITGTPDAKGIYVNGGAVVFGTAPLSTDVVVIVRVPSAVQNFSLINSGTISSTAIVNEFDYITILLQRALDLASRAIALPDGFSGTFNLSLPTILTPNMALAINSTGNGLALIAASGGGGGGGSGITALTGDVTASGTGIVAATISSLPRTKLALGALGQVLINDSSTGAMSSETYLAKVRGGTGVDNSSVTFPTTGIIGTVPSAGFVKSSGGTSFTSVSGISLTSEVAGVLPLANGGTGAATQAAAAIAVLPSQSGQSGNYLKTDGTNASWAAGGGGFTSPLTTKGDVHVFSTTDARLGVGANNTVLTADSTQPTGLKWAAAASGTPTTTKGDLAGFDTASNRVPVGANNTVLTADSTQPLGLKWATPAQSSSVVATSVTSTYSILTTDSVVLCSASGAAFTVTLPTAVGSSQMVTIKKTDSSSNIVTLATTSAQTIDGLSTYKMGTQYDSVTLVSNGANWSVTNFNIECGVRYTSSATNSVGTTATAIAFATKGYDALNQYSGSTFTALYPGKYVIAGRISTTGVTLTTSQFFTSLIYYNGSQIGANQVNGNGAASISVTSTIGDEIQMAAGDTMAIFAIASVATTLSGSPVYCSFAINRIGN